MTLLAVEQLTVQYGVIRALHGIDLRIEAGEIVTLLGANGAGKSTTLRAISRLIPIADGRVVFDGEAIAHAPAHRLLAKGMAHVPEGRGIFAALTVHENLRLAAWTNRDAQHRRTAEAQVFALFPRLAERQQQLAGTLSGGEQQMLAIGRALMTRCRLLLLDEPSMGLSPLLVKEVFRALKAINAQGTTIFLVEQNANLALSFAHRGYVLENGRIVLSGPAPQLRQNPQVQAAYLGR